MESSFDFNDKKEDEDNFENYELVNDDININAQEEDFLEVICQGQVQEQIEEQPIVISQNTQSVFYDAKKIKEMLGLREIPIALFIQCNKKTHVMILSKNVQQYYMPVSEDSELAKEINKTIEIATDHAVAFFVSEKKLDGYIRITVKEFLRYRYLYQSGLDSVISYPDQWIDWTENNKPNEVLFSMQDYKMQMFYHEREDRYIFYVNTKDDLIAVQRLQKKWSHSVVQTIIPNAIYSLSRDEYLKRMDDSVVCLRQEEITPFVDSEVKMMNFSETVQQNLYTQKHPLILKPHNYKYVVFSYIQGFLKQFEFNNDANDFDVYRCYLDNEFSDTTANTLNKIFKADSAKDLFYYDDSNNSVFIAKSDFDENIGKWLRQTSLVHAGNVRLGPKIGTNETAEEKSTEYKNQTASLMSIFKKQHGLDDAEERKPKRICRPQNR